MSLIDLASMVLAPTAVKDGKVYNAIPNDQDFTFSRGTEATRVNSAGLIEKARTNFALYSNDFSQSVWQKLNNAVVSGQTATDPYGNANSAWDIVFDGTTSGRIEQSISGVISGGVYAPSIWARTKSGTQVVSFGSVFTENFTLTTEWQRISLYEVENDTTAYLRLVCNDAITLEVYAAQLEQGLVATDYIDTTTSSVTVGITDDLPRVDYSGGGCPSLLLEPSRTQLLPQSEYFGAWNNARTIDTDNQAISPEGLLNAAYLEQQSGQTNAGSLYLGLTFPSTGDYTTSIFAKKGEKDFIVAYDKNTNRTYFNLDTGTVGTTPAGVTASIEDFGNGWYRCSATFNTAAGGSNIAWYLGDTDNSSTVTDSGGVYIYGAMLEAGSYVSSYIPTYGTSTSRSADSCSLTNASNLIGQSEGTLFVDVKVTLDGRLLLIGAAGNFIETLINSSGKVNAFVRTSVTEADILSTATYSTGDTLKVAFAYKQNDFALYVNGTAQGTDTNGNVPTNMAQIIINDYLAAGYNSANGYNQAILFPTRLTNDQLAELTK